MTKVASRVTHVADRQALAEEHLIIEGDAYRHLFRARRLDHQASLRIVDGDGRARRGSIEAIDRQRAKIALHETLEAGEPTLRVTLVAAALKPERAGMLVEKATELGVSRIVFAATERTPRHYGEGRLERWRRIAISAVEQSHRSRVPAIDGVVPLDRALGEALGELARGELARGELGSGDQLYAMVPGAPPLARLTGLSNGSVGALTLVVGPEGGWADGDLETLADRGVVHAGLGVTVLRAETAALAALAVVLCR